MNRIYRLCWNRSSAQWVPACEFAKSTSPGSARRRVIGHRTAMLSVLSLALGMTGLACADTTGGQVTAGVGQISQSGNTTTIRQSSQNLSLSWQSFDIAANQTVDFLQPGSSSIAVNRILGNTASDIEGHLNANGQVWLINPNGVLFGKNAQVNVGGIVASTLDLDQSTLGTGTVRFSGNGKGSVVNLGTITVTPGGYAALLGNTVSNQGTIRAQLGTVALAGGTAMTLTFADNRLVHLVVNANTVQSLVENRQLIVADGGQVLMTAGARNSLIDSVVNNTGTVQAQTVQDHNGTITLLGGMQAGTVNVAGTLDASAPNGGNGGFIETSGAQAYIANGAVITTKAAPGGKDGTWLVDPTDFTIASSGGDITATTLESQLASGNVAFTSASGASGTSGNVNVNQAVTWGANTTLTLTASNNVNLNAAITNTGAGGKTVLNAGNAFVNNVGASGLGGHWAIYSASPAATGENLGSLTPNFIQYNAPIGTAAATGATGNGVFYSTKPTLTVTGLTGTVTKSYDGATTATLAGNNITDSGLINGDTISSAAGTYSQSDVGTGLTVTSPSSITSFDIVNGSIPVYGYTLSGTGKTANIGTINAAQLYATVIGDPTKVYDGTTTATLASSNYYITGLAAGQSVTVNQPSSVGYASADVNTNGGTTPNGGLVAVNASFASTNFVAGSGTKLSNYILPTATSTTAAALAADSTAGYGTITPAPVYLSGVQSTNKTYDATTNDPLNISNASIYGVVNGDNVTLDTSGASGNFASPNAGNNLAVTLSGFNLTGSNATKVADYALIAPTNLTADIYQKALTVAGVTATDKVYDGTTTDTLGTGNAVLSGFVNAADQASTTLATSSATGAFSQADVGNALAVTVSGLTVNNSNYSVTQPTGLTANITPASLTIAFSGSADKIYDGTDYATLSTPNFTVSGAVAGQTVAVNQAPAVYTGADAPNVGTDTVTATLQSSDLTFASGAKAGNYTFNTSVVGSGSITPAPLTIAINDNPTRTFDGTEDTSASLTAGNFVLSGVIPGQTINLDGAFAGNYYDTSNAAAPGAASYEGNAGTWGVVAALTGANFSAGSSTSLSNYQLPTTALGYGTILPKALGISIVAGITGASKTYDGNTSLTLTPGNFNLSGFVNGDSATVNQNIAGTFATKNVGSQPITATLQESDFNFTGSDEGNYTFPVMAYGTGTINPATLTVSIIGNPTKTYDGNTTVLPLTGGTQLGTAACPTATCNFQVAGFVNGEGATINPTASFTYATANVARDSNGNVVGGTDAITGSLTQNNYIANSGTLLSNYTLDYAPTGYGTINPASLYVNGVYAQNKIYDGGTGALVNISNGQLAGLADVDKNAGDITLSIGNSTSSTADGVSGSTGGTLVPNSNGSFTATGSPVSGAFASANAGNGQVVTTIFNLGGSSAGNYTLEPLTLTANITPRPLSVTGISANNKSYDGTTAATFTFTTPSFSQAGGTGSSVNGLLSQDASNVSLNQGSGTGTFATPNANTNPSGAFLSTNGQPITVTANGFTLNGSAASNYVLSQPTGLSADIAQAQITANLTGSITKMYDGTSTITIPAADYSTSGWVAGQGGTITQTQSGYYGDPGSPQSNAGTYDVTANLVSSDWKPNAGTSLSNYALPSQVVGNMIGTIAPLVLNLSATRVYDATTDIYSSLSGNVTNADNANVFGTLNGINGDQFTVTGQGTASNKNVGTYTGANFTLGTLALQASSGNASNYTLVGGVDTYTITKAPLDVTGATVATKVYDGTTTASVNGATLTQGNAKGDVLGSDVVTIGSSNIAGTFSDKNAGNGKTVNITPSDVGGSDAGNYQLVQPANLTGDITQRPVTIGGSRQYDGTDTAVGGSGATWQNPGAVSGNASSGVVSGDTVKVNGGSGSVALADVGTYNSDGSGAGTFDATGLTLSNTNYAIASTGNTFQITPMVLTLSGTRVYDGTANADADLVTSLNGSSSGITDCGADCVTLTGANGEKLNLAGTGTGALSSANVAGTSSSPTKVSFVTSGGGIAGLTLNGNSGAKASNYTLAGGVTITPYVLSFSGTRVYDGTNKVNAGNLVDATAGSATLGSTTFSGVGTDTFTLSGTGSLGSANAGHYGGTASGTSGTPSGTAQVGVGGLTLVPVSGISNNYTLVGGNDTYDISQAVITLTGVRQYDGTQTVNGNGSVVLIDGTPASCTAGDTCWGVSTSNVYTGDLGKLTVASNGSTVSSANVGTYNDNGGGFVDGLTLGGSAAGNYTLATTGNQFIIDKAALIVTAQNASKTYDGLAYSGGNGVTYTGLVNNETSSVLGGNLVYGGTSQGAINAGNYSISASGLSSNNYAISYVDGTLDVGKAALTVTAQNASKTYDGLAYSGGNGVTYTGLVNNETSSVLGGSLVYGGTSQGAINAGNYGITASGLSSGNYAISYVDGALDVGKAALTVTAQDASKTYDGLAYSGGNGVTYTGLVNNETSSVLGGSLVYGGTSQGAINAGNYGITASGLSSNNYTISYVDGALDVGKAALTVTAQDASKTYDGLAYSGGNGVTYSGLVNNETSSVLGGSLAYGGTSQGAINAGNYGITASGLSSNNYTISYVDGALDVGKAALTVTAQDASKTYDGLAYSGGNGVTYTGLVNNETSSVLGGSLVYGGTSQGAINAGNYGITASGLSSNNYTISYVDGALDVGKAALTVTAQNASKTYDGLAYSGGNGVTYTGLVNNETSSVLGGSLVYGGTSQGAINAGNYGITASGLSSGNYTISYVDGALDVGKAALTVTAQDASKTYDGLAYSGGNGVTYSGLVNNETSSVLGGSLAYGGTSQGAINAGNYSITASGLSSGNYTISYVDGALDVGKAALIVTAQNASKTYDGLAYSGGNGVTYTGLVNNETSSVLGGNLVYGGTSQGAINAGNYGITASGLSSNNYAISYVDGALDVGKAALTVTAQNASKTYDGLAYSGGNGVTYTGLVNNETSSVLGGSLAYGGTSQGAINAGNYGITASGLSSGNYTISYVDGALDVGKAALTVTAQDASKTYDGLAYSGGNGVTYTGLVNNETSSVLGGSLAYGGTSQGAINAGNYGITASGLSSNNYAISYVDGALDVGKAILNLAGTRVYDGTTNADAGALTTISGLVGNETVVISGTGEVGDKNVGTNKALTGLGNLALADGSNGGLAGNYTLAGGIDTLTITPKAITVAATAADKTYDGNATAVVTSLTSSGIVGNDTVDFADTAATFSDANAGTGKTVTVGGITANGTDAGNYTVNNTATTTADIDKAVLNLSGTRVYDADTDANAKLLAISGLVGNETVVLSGVGQVGDKNVGTDKPFANLDTLALADGSNGGLAGNYTLVGGTDTLTITPATLTVAGTTVGTKTYDGNTTASLAGSTLKGLLGSDSVALGNDATGTFASANAGTESVTTGMTIGGTDAGNYIIVQPSGLVGTINPYVLNLSGTRVYDGTTNAIASAFGNGGLLTGINGETVNLGGTGQVGDKNVGSDKLFTSLGSLTLSDGSNGGLAGNYTLVGGVDTLSITPKTLVADATGTSKIYNGNTLDTVTLGSAGVVAGDSVQFGYGTANFSDPTIGSDKLVTVTGVQLSGADAGNYLLASPTVYTQANITGAQASAFGISNGTLASVDSVLNSKVLATPYGLAAQESVGTFIGNKKRLHRPVERNVSRGDFSSGLALKVIDGGVRPPAQALP